MIFSAADSATGIALLGLLRRGEHIATLEMKINYLKPVADGEIMAETRIVHRGKQTAVGIIANQPMFNAGAMDTDGIDKVVSFLCLADSFNIPLLFFHDIPGFLVGKDAERKRAGGFHMLRYLGFAISTIKINFVGGNGGDQIHQRTKYKIFVV